MEVTHDNWPQIDQTLKANGIDRIVHFSDERFVISSGDSSYKLSWEMASELARQGKLSNELLERLREVPRT